MVTARGGVSERLIFATYRIKHQEKSAGSRNFSEILAAGKQRSFVEYSVRLADAGILTTRANADDPTLYDGQMVGNRTADGGHTHSCHVRQHVQETVQRAADGGVVRLHPGGHGGQILGSGLAGGHAHQLHHQAACVDRNVRV